MDIQIGTTRGAGPAVLAASDAVFAAPYNEALVHQVVVAWLAGARAGTKAQKSRGEVAGSNKKPWRQKGLGRARAGSTRSPLWRKGGVTFAAEPRDHSQKVNRKMYRGAMRAILSELHRSGRLKVVDALGVPETRTRALLALLESLGVHDALLVLHEFDVSLALAARNLHHVHVCTSSELDPVSLIGFESVVMTEAAVKQLEARLS